MSELGKLAGVNASTVSRALSGHPSIPEATQAAIQKLAREHGYVLNRSAKSLRQNQTQTVAVVAPVGHLSEQLVTDPFFLQLFGHTADEVTRRRYDVLLVLEPSPDSNWLDRLIMSNRADAFIIAGQSDQHTVLNKAASTFLPMVVDGSPIAGQKYCSVGSDDFGGGRAATEHLLRGGRRRIMFLGPAALPQVDMRLAGYRDALSRAGLPIDPALIVHAGFAGASASEAIDTAFASGLDFDSIFAASDGIAMAAIKALEMHGRPCPEYIHVVGFDDSPIASATRPTLTTIRQDIPRIASTTVDFLFRRLAGENTPSVTLPVELVVRESAP